MQGSHALDEAAIDDQAAAASEARLFRHLELMPCPVVVLRGSELRCVFQNPLARAVLGDAGMTGILPDLRGPGRPHRSYLSGRVPDSLRRDSGAAPTRGGAGP